MRIATWNVNSCKARMPRLLPWLESRGPDVLLLQETKSTDEAWPAADFERAGYTSFHSGEGRWNGVAILSRVDVKDVTVGLPDQPQFDGVTEARAIGATCAGVRLWSLYVPNGRGIDTPHYAYKLAFLEQLRRAAEHEALALGADVPFGLLGDFNVAPRDSDVWDVSLFAGATHVTTLERAAIEALGLSDVRPRASEDPADQRLPWTFWEMRMLGFQKGRGMRIDLALGNDALVGRVRDAWVDRDARKGQGPSDHAPLILDLDWP